jgi:predicted metal-dependent HD superfamily phosphohydrolase
VSTERVSVQAWSALWARLGARSDPRPIHQEIRRAYGEPHRHYHTLEHIGRVLDLLDGVSGQLRHPSEAELALWLHDVIYHPQAPDNEERSAAYAQDLLHGGHVEPRVGERVAALILATRHVAGAAAAAGDHPDTAYVLDADLSILGAPEAEFDRYEAQVRREYGYRTDEEWRQGRMRVLALFQERPRIYLTEAFAHLEAPSRANLARSLARLAAAASRAGGELTTPAAARPRHEA